MQPTAYHRGASGEEVGWSTLLLLVWWEEGDKSNSSNNGAEGGAPALADLNQPSILRSSSTIVLSFRNSPSWWKATKALIIIILMGAQCIAYKYIVL